MKKLALIFALLAAVGTAAAIYEIFLVTPLEMNIDAMTGRLDRSSLFFNYKIMFFHVGHAFVLFCSVFVAGIASAGYLKTQNPKWDDVASAAVEVAVAFGAVVLVTGSIWGKAAWGNWWHWEPRLTMSLLLWLILVGYVLVRRFAGTSGDRIAAGMAIFGMIGVPFIYALVGSDSHPNSGSNGVVANLPAGMHGAFWLSVAALMCWFLALVLTRIESTRAERELRDLREHALDLGVL